MRGRLEMPISPPLCGEFPRGHGRRYQIEAFNFPVSLLTGPDVHEHRPSIPGSK
jgi:hypothetical protein